MSAELVNNSKDDEKKLVECVNVRRSKICKVEGSKFMRGVVYDGWMVYTLQMARYRTRDKGHFQLLINK